MNDALDLPEHDVDLPASERIRRRAQRAFARRAALAAHPRLARVERLYARAVEPALVTGACALYLAWAAQHVLALR